MEIVSAQVTRDEISDAKKGHRGKCAIAMAIAMTYPDARYIRVDRDSIRFTDVKTRIRYTYRTPRNAQKFIDNWDAGRKMLGFTLELPDSLLVDMRVMGARSPRAMVSTPAEPKTRRGPTTRRPTHA